jgi:glucose/arabinose dehydrogenase
MRAFCLSLLTLALLAVPAMAEMNDQAPGQRFQFDPDKLPAPAPEESVANSPNIIALSDPPPFVLPPGFAVNKFAGPFTYPRWLAVAPNGDVFLALPDSGEVMLLRDAQGAGKASLATVYARGFHRPHGLAVHGDHLYVADMERVWRLPWHPGDIRAAGKVEPVTAQGALGSGQGHWTRNIAFAPDGKRFFVDIGSADNIGEDPSPRATVQSFAANGSGQRTFATGLRNAVGIAFYPGTDDLYVVVNERDGMGNGLVPDFLTRLVGGGFYGWPYAYIGQHPQPDFPQRPDMVAKTIVPDLLFQPHSAPLGLVFYEGAMFPAEYAGDAFVSLHGSWNAAQPTGYKIVRVPFKNGRPVGYYENFLTGFWSSGESPANVFGRPVGLAVAKDGSLLVADDVSGIIWRVSYRKP